jgi:hypothetical protein
VVKAMDNSFAEEDDDMAEKIQAVQLAFLVEEDTEWECHRRNRDKFVMRQLFRTELAPEIGLIVRKLRHIVAEEDVEAELGEHTSLTGVTSSEDSSSALTLRSSELDSDDDDDALLAAV